MHTIGQLSIANLSLIKIRGRLMAKVPPRTSVYKVYGILATRRRRRKTDHMAFPQFVVTKRWSLRASLFGTSCIGRPSLTRTLLQVPDHLLL